MTGFNADTKYIGKNYLWLEETDSTNSMMRRLLRNGTTIESRQEYGVVIEGTPREGMMIISDYQSLGRGRSGKNWISAPGDGIALSLLLMPESMGGGTSCITLVAALSVAAAIEKTSGLKPQIKWPNDILLNEKKVCGILTELDTTQGKNSIIVGVGINSNQQEFPAEISETATSIFLETGTPSDRESTVKYFSEYFEKYYEIFLKTSDMSLLKEEYNSLLVNKGRVVKVFDPKENIMGIAEGIDDEGRLIVKTDTGITHHIYAGEVSVRGIYGYV